MQQAKIIHEQAVHDNKLLGQITLVTSLGDWLTYFALMKLATDVSGSVIIGTLSIAMKSAAIAVGAVLIPMFVGVFPSRVIILVAQWISALLMGAVCLSIGNKFALPVSAIYATLFVQTILKQLFDAARESHSKGLALTDADHRPMQAEILRGLFGAQFFGPLLAFVLLSKTPLWVPVLVDCLTFTLSGFLAFGIGPSHPTQSAIDPMRFLKPLKYLSKYPRLRDILVFRSVVFWIPNGLYNILLFQVVMHHYGRPLEHSTLPYAALGLGAAAASLLLRHPMSEAKTWLGKRRDGTLACLAQIGFALSTLGFLVIPSFELALVFVLVTGLAMGVNAISTQSLRRRLSTAEQLPEVMGLELLIGRATDILVMTGMATALDRGILSYQTGVFIAVAWFIVSGLLHLRFRE